MTTTTRIRHAREYRRYVRSQAKAASHVPISVVDGAAAPQVTGESYHWETRGGRRVWHPSAYSRKGWSSLVYCASTISVEVGRDWLAQRRIPADAMAVA